MYYIGSSAYLCDILLNDENSKKVGQRKLIMLAYKNEEEPHISVSCPSNIFILLFCGSLAKQHGTLPTMDACAYEFTMVK